MNAQTAKFVEGSTMHHILVMSGSGSVGLMALFAVDLLDMLFISMLGQIELAAAVGFAGTLMFFSTSVSIGTSIAMGALVSKAIGAKEFDNARQLSGSIMLTAFAISLVFTVFMFAYIPELLALIGAEGTTAERAEAYLQILVPSGPFLAVAMAAGAGLRSAGDAKRSMWVTLSGGIVNAILDPIFIFGFNWNVEGAALASVISRFAVLYFSLYPLIKHHNLVSFPSLSQWLKHIKAILKIAVPAIFTNAATPIGNAIVTTSIAQYGNDFVAGYAVIGRLIPVCFAAIFALSGAVGPIIGQNLGAKRIDRVKETLYNSLLVTFIYTLFVCLILFFVQDYIVQGFTLEGDAVLIVQAFCTYVAITFVFNGAIFVANTSFNNLGKPIYSTILSLGRATIGTLPFVYLGSLWFGALGVLYGQALGNIIFGVIAILVLQRHIKELMLSSAADNQSEADTAQETANPVQAEAVLEAAAEKTEETVSDTQVDWQTLAKSNPACEQALKEDDEIPLSCLNAQPFCTLDAVLIDDLASHKDELVTAPMINSEERSSSVINNEDEKELKEK
ncbi:multidrug transporter MatE [Marinomonas sp. SBI22]|uniref:MATE family efflux transporter n=1 Tax=unclassified Marinomonas TaxID=196814 RepID=UPI0007AEF343|nr:MULTISPECIES: MATE family efflux transporter [unclassified Marinomonas]KZM40815.1 multidrug transporter MatE [Marinomonas sp. SBI8L]KZM46000.1 multidrug transporter MatE [Marinomonas sp. SBI22]